MEKLRLGHGEILLQPVKHTINSQATHQMHKRLLILKPIQLLGEFIYEMAI
jgi:hypothetical protein